MKYLKKFNEELSPGLIRRSGVKWINQRNNKEVGEEWIDSANKIENLHYNMIFSSNKYSAGNIYKPLEFYKPIATISYGDYKFYNEDTAKDFVKNWKNGISPLEFSINFRFSPTIKTYNLLKKDFDSDDINHFKPFKFDVSLSDFKSGLDDWNEFSDWWNENTDFFIKPDDDDHKDEIYEFSNQFCIGELNGVSYIILTDDFREFKVKPITSIKVELNAFLSDFEIGEIKTNLVKANGTFKMSYDGNVIKMVNGVIQKDDLFSLYHKTKSITVKLRDSDSYPYYGLFSDRKSSNNFRKELKVIIDDKIEGHIYEILDEVAEIADVEIIMDKIRNINVGILYDDTIKFDDKKSISGSFDKKWFNKIISK